jgi:hypothetical protein
MALHARQLRTPRKRSKRQERKGQAEALRVWLLNKLNSDSTAPVTVRITSLLKLLMRLETLRCELFEQREWDGLARHRPELDAKNREFQTALSDLRELLSRYRWTPQVFPENFYSLNLCWAFGAKSKEKSWENLAAAWLLQQLTAGSRGSLKSSVARFRKCRECRVWFYAITDHQKHCSDDCRKKHHASSPEFMEKRKMYMRKRRRKEKDEYGDNLKTARHLAAERSKGEA